MTAGPTLDSLPTRHHRDEEEEPDTIEVHNHIPASEDYFDRARDDEEPHEERHSQGEVVARFPANGFSAVTEGDEIVVYRGSGSPEHKTDRFDFDTTARDSRSRPPRTLAELNRLHSAHYGRRGAGR